MRVAVNGSETDEDVEADSAPWLEKVVNLRISGGGGGPAKRSQPFACSFSLAVPLNDAIKVRTITVAVEGPWTGTLKTWMESDTTDRAYRVVYNGDVVAARCGILSGTVEFDSLDDMYALGTKRARVTALASTDVYNVLVAIDGGLGGSPSFPSSSETFMDGSTSMIIYRPAQQRTVNADYIATALAGTGVNMSVDWDGVMAGPQFRWRPDHYYPGVTTARQMNIPMPRPQAYDFSDMGYAYQDHYARIDIAGASSTTNYYGWARLDNAADRNALNNRAIGLTGMWNTAGRCAAAARTVLGQTVYPAYMHPFRINVSADHHYSTLSGWTGATGESQEETGFHLAACMLGDRLRYLTGSDTGYESVSTALGSAKADFLDDVFAPTWTDAGGTMYTFYHDIRSLTRYWTPSGGWFLELGTLPDWDPATGTGPYDSGDATDYGSGTD